MSVDNGALRIAPLITPGWARAGLSYGPFERCNGLAFAVFMLNGHNTAQSENLPDSFRSRLNQWLAGAGVFPRWRRLLQWLRAGRKGRTWRQWRWWRATAIDAAPVPRIDDNLSIGWFDTEVPADPTRQGSSLIMRATGAENGELRARAGDGLLETARGVQNLQIQYVVVLREAGAIYYAASVPNAHGLACLPSLRPLGVDPFGDASPVYAGVHQSTLGQIGFRLDTRVYGARVAVVEEWSAWHGSACAADRFEGKHGAAGPAGSVAEAGGAWQSLSAALDRHVLLSPRVTAGLIHVLVEAGSNQRMETGLVWRCLDADNHWELMLTGQGCTSSVVEHGQRTPVAGSTRGLEPGRKHSIQILDDGARISVHLDGELLFDRHLEDRRLGDASRVGVVWPDAASGIRLHRFEAHPRACALPAILDMGRPWWRLGEVDAVTEDFDGPARDLAGKVSTTGARQWSRLSGQGHMDIDGSGQAKVRAEPSRANPGRTLYAIDWDSADFADLEIEITPPGTARGQAQGGRAGLMFWQDEDHYVLVNNWLADSYAGASISCFTCVGGFEDLYDAVWSNVGDDVRWGVPHRLRVVFDGERLMAMVDDAPVLYRALSDIYPDARAMHIRKVGLVANWEWGNDTGSTLRCFRGRT